MTQQRKPGISGHAHGGGILPVLFSCLFLFIFISVSYLYALSSTFFTFFESIYVTLHTMTFFSTDHMGIHAYPCDFDSVVVA